MTHSFWIIYVSGYYHHFGSLKSFISYNGSMLLLNFKYGRIAYPHPLINNLDPVYSLILYLISNYRTYTTFIENKRWHIHLLPRNCGRRNCDRTLSFICYCFLFSSINSPMYVSHSFGSFYLQYFLMWRP